MTIKHIVLFKFKQNISPSQITQVMQALEHLKNLIPEVLSYSGGKDMSIENLHRGFTHGFTMDFKNEADRDLYVDHPEHVKVVQELILPALSDELNSSLVFDYVY
jgi:hypothetical protein